jgi:hypothetical protein
MSPLVHEEESCVVAMEYCYNLITIQSRDEYPNDE